MKKPVNVLSARGQKLASARQRRLLEKIKAFEEMYMRFLQAQDEFPEIEMIGTRPLPRDYGLTESIAQMVMAACAREFTRGRG